MKKKAKYSHKSAFWFFDGRKLKTSPSQLKADALRAGRSRTTITKWINKEHHSGGESKKKSKENETVNAIRRNRVDDDGDARYRPLASVLSTGKIVTRGTERVKTNIIPVIGGVLCIRDIWFEYSAFCWIEKKV